jgi:hypothetical protein
MTVVVVTDGLVAGTPVLGELIVVVDVPTSPSPSPPLREAGATAASPPVSTDWPPSREQLTLMRPTATETTTARVKARPRFTGTSSRPLPTAPASSPGLPWRRPIEDLLRLNASELVGEVEEWARRSETFQWALRCAWFDVEGPGASLANLAGSGRLGSRAFSPGPWPHRLAGAQNARVRHQRMAGDVSSLGPKPSSRIDRCADSPEVRPPPDNHRYAGR